MIDQDLQRHIKNLVQQTQQSLLDQTHQSYNEEPPSPVPSKEEQADAWGLVSDALQTLEEAFREGQASSILDYQSELHKFQDPEEYLLTFRAEQHTLRIRFRTAETEVLARVTVDDMTGPVTKGQSFHIPTHEVGASMVARLVVQSFEQWAARLKGLTPSKTALPEVAESE